MGLRRLVVRHGEALRLHRRVKQWSSFGTCVALLCFGLLALAHKRFFPSSDVLASDFELEGHEAFGDGLNILDLQDFDRRLECKKKESASAYPPDPIISKRGDPKSYKNAPAAEKAGIIVHIIIVGYMLLGLNTVCDIYFCGALDMMVDKWKVQPDVAGATFMAAGGSAPELFTSLIGAVVTVNDVGFGTIVGSAVFNVLAVIGACGMCAETPIQLTWWPLFRDCCYYIFGLCLLALCAYGKTKTNDCGDKEGGGSINLWETFVLFGAYIGYCILMYFSGPLQAKVQGIVDKMKGRTEGQDVAQSTIKVAPMPDADQSGEAKPLKDLRAGGQGDNATPGPPDHHKGCDQGAPAENPQAKEGAQEENPQPKAQATKKTLGSQLELPSASGEPPKASPRGTGSHHHIEHHIRVVHHKVHMTKSGEREVRRTSKNGLVSPRPGDEERRPSNRSNGSKNEERRPSNRSQGSKTDEKMEEGAKDGEEEKKEGEDGDSEESDDIAALMIMPEDMKERIMWFLSLPIYAALYYCIPKPTERCFLACFIIALGWIAAFSFVLVYCVELFCEAILGGGNNVTVVMGFTVLAAGTSIPDLVSSMAVARAGEGDMAVSSSIGSNIFDILVGLPIPWMIKIGLVERSTEYTIQIKSPYIALYVLLLLFMVFCVIVSIHCLGWKLNKTLGACMAGLYVVFLAVVLPVELVNDGPYV